MAKSPQSATDKLDAIAAEFADLEPRERLELLLDFAEGLPALPPQLESQKAEHRVHECQTPVYLWVLLDQGKVRIYADVAPEAPTVKGFVGILVSAFDGASADSVLVTDPNILRRLGLIEALGMVRMRGLSAILARIRSEVGKAQAASGSTNA